MRVITQEELPFSRIAHELVGDDHGASVGTFFADEDERETRAGEVIILPPGTPPGFRNSGDGPLRQLDIHLSPRFDTEWLA